MTCNKRSDAARAPSPSHSKRCPRTSGMSESIARRSMAAGNCASKARTTTPETSRAAMMRKTCTTASPSAAAARLPMGGLLALAMTGFIAVLTENMPAGLLPEISRGLGVSQALAGQLVTLYALGAVVAAIPLMVATRGWSRRSLLLLAIGGFFVFNTVTALSDHYVVTLAARFVAGIAAGLAWGLL